ncbi:SusC/RagA family TonB-linked outer membrane protein [Belliella sp. R4-6]|uniref:SusC/RagA family TonB-linked outer membrane protein n=1 Tax=Belliella alkalica TaxID=1730871 RepID=A0ABS9VFP2_9BACT|nr:SusC/RagA family TonB-linked outer membrane protein [Belliella alkalica]MCH7415261.1 SusC/RagA family TonB-linked outer membrane protein [Belliella alkalica]
MKHVVYLLKSSLRYFSCMSSVMTCFLVLGLAFFGQSKAYSIGKLEKYQSEQQVTGKVISAQDGLPLPGVTVMEKNTGNGTVTDINGEFSLSLRNPNPILIFSYIGFETQEFPLANQSRIEIELGESTQAMSEVVVTALGIEREKRSLGYAVGEVKGDALRTVVQENPMNALAGRVAGVTVNQVSGVGSSTNIVIRGATSLTSDNQPLFVIDGVPVSNSMNNIRNMGDRNEVDYGSPISDLSPEDIEEITVLKGPSAAALYGSRAGNGVILVTTKKGKAGEPIKVNFTTSNVFEKPYRYLDFHYMHGSGVRPTLLDERSAAWVGPRLDAGITAVQWNSPLGADGNRIPTELRSYPDNMKNFLETGLTSTNSVSVAGSSQKATYRFGFTNMIHNGMIPNTDLFRNNLSLSNSFKITDRLTFNTDINLTRSNSNNRAATGNRGANPLQAVYNWPHVDIRELRDIWVPGQEHIQQLSVSPNDDNPYFIAYGINNSFVRDRIFGNVKLDYKFNEQLFSHLRLTMDTYTENRETKIPWSYTRERKGAFHLQDIGRTETNIEFLTTYSKQINDFNLSISGGGNIMRQMYSENYMGSARNAGLIVPGLYRVNNIPNAGLQYNNFSSEKSIYSVFGIASMGFKDQLYLDLTARNDWSSTLPAQNRSYFYPSASLSWLANYTFDLPSNISMLKFRAGVAQAGNDTNPYALEPVLGTSNWGDLITTNYPGTLLNPNLKPEINTSQEYGVDLNLFNNLIRLEATYFYQKNENQILNIPTPQSTGFNQRQINAGLISSRGWEIHLGATPIRNQNGLTLDIGANFTRMRTKLEKLTDGMDFLVLWEDNEGGASTFVGGQIGDLWSRGYAYVEDPNSPYYKWPILDNNGSWTLLNGRETRRKVGNFNPDAIIGLQTSLKYKRWTLDANFDLRLGGDFMSFTYRYGESDWKSKRQMDLLIPGGLYSQEELIALLKSDPDRFIIPSNGNFPRVGGYDSYAGGLPVNMGPEGNDGVFVPGVIRNAEGEYVEHLGGPGTRIHPIASAYPWRFNQQVTFDASFLKLRELSVGYQLPKVSGFQNIHVSVFTRNLMLWTKSKIGIDPERAFQASGSKQGDSANLFRQGIELQNVMPWTMPFGFKINANF